MGICPYGKVYKEDQRQYIMCDIMNSICLYQRFCMHEHKAVFTDMANKCKVRDTNEK